jgi:hypothetical protein
MKKYRILIPAGIILLLIFAWNIPVSTTSDVLPVSVNVSDDGIIGVHMTKEEQRELNFGMIFPGAATTKTINLSRGNSPPAQVHIEIEGEIEHWTELGRNDFILTGPAQVNVTLTIPEGTEQGKYTGSATVRYTTYYGASLMHLFSGGRT